MAEDDPPTPSVTDSARSAASTKPPTSSRLRAMTADPPTPSVTDSARSAASTKPPTSSRLRAMTAECWSKRVDVVTQIRDTSYVGETQLDGPELAWPSCLVAGLAVLLYLLPAPTGAYLWGSMLTPLIACIGFFGLIRRRAQTCHPQAYLTRIDRNLANWGYVVGMGASQFLPMPTSVQDVPGYLHPFLCTDFALAVTYVVVYRTREALDMPVEVLQKTKVCATYHLWRTVGLAGLLEWGVTATQLDAYFYVRPCIAAIRLVELGYSIGTIIAEDTPDPPDAPKPASDDPWQPLLDLFVRGQWLCHFVVCSAILGAQSVGCLLFRAGVYTCVMTVVCDYVWYPFQHTRFYCCSHWAHHPWRDKAWACLAAVCRWVVAAFSLGQGVLLCLVCPPPDDLSAPTQTRVHTLPYNTSNATLKQLSTMLQTSRARHRMERELRLQQEDEARASRGVGRAPRAWCHYVMLFATLCLNRADVYAILRDAYDKGQWGVHCGCLCLLLLCVFYEWVMQCVLIVCSTWHVNSAHNVLAETADLLHDFGFVTKHHEQLFKRYNETLGYAKTLGDCYLHTNVDLCRSGICLTMECPPIYEHHSLCTNRTLLFHFCVACRKCNNTIDLVNVTERMLFREHSALAADILRDATAKHRMPPRCEADIRNAPAKLENTSLILPPFMGYASQPFCVLPRREKRVETQEGVNSTRVGAANQRSSQAENTTVHTAEKTMATTVSENITVNTTESENTTEATTESETTKRTENTTETTTKTENTTETTTKTENITVNATEGARVENEATESPVGSVDKVEFHLPPVVDSTLEYQRQSEAQREARQEDAKAVSEVAEQARKQVREARQEVLSLHARNSLYDSLTLARIFNDNTFDLNVVNWGLNLVGGALVATTPVSWALDWFMHSLAVAALNAVTPFHLQEGVVEWV